MNVADEKSALKALQALPNIGPACARDLFLLGYRAPTDLKGEDGVEMYERLCAETGIRHDPCVLDTFRSAVHFADTGEAKKWWEFTALRKGYAAACEPISKANSPAAKSNAGRGTDP